MQRLMTTAALLALLAGCGDGQPFDDPLPGEDGGGEDAPGETPDDGEGEDGGIGGDGALPPGTAEPSAAASIRRREALDGEGGGYVSAVAYDAGTDSFSVDNLAFDGANTYARADEVGTLNGFAVYEADRSVADPATGAGIDQLDYRALYGVSRGTVEVDGERLPRSRFAIVRTGDYTDYGFGGFLYERNGAVTLPTSGQAVYAGDYAGLRIFDGRTGTEYTRGDMRIAIDFEDFDAGDGVQGRITNREILDAQGTPLALGTGEGAMRAPDVIFDIGPGALDANGEMSGPLNSYDEAEDGGRTPYETGTYYGVIAGEDAGEIAGIIVLQSDDPRTAGVTVQETGGFIVYR
ncbi:hypothetical protein [Pseudoroseicyclus aestuarii]|uniref:Uncharacterized protein n=1 Tax=Pseudoroseicyclus aestuarii TaxID=1795041 RepID=A0A318SVP9_9RHOB|nr:hypothetical protein [Pseudoroseicyclus aestuarii]PYE83927.1 hypothetical protein DFP88_103288 [Pseudoroseicyclus aestuarii]